MAQKQNILNLWKKVGETPLECLNHFQECNSIYKEIPMTYVGRLDPMAEGVLLVLAHDTKSQRDELLNLDKVYEFESLWGIETDTYDVLGKIINATFKNPKQIDIEEKIKNYLGKRNQEYPPFSSKTVKGKPLFAWAREGRVDEIEMPKKVVEIYSLESISTKNILGQELLAEIVGKISKVKGDFRQEEIICLWKKTLENKTSENFVITKMKAHVSSGTYIRSLIHEIGRELGCGAIAFGITRTKVGEYSEENSLV